MPSPGGAAELEAVSGDRAMANELRRLLDRSSVSRSRASLRRRNIVSHLVNNRFKGAIVHQGFGGGPVPINSLTYGRRLFRRGSWLEETSTERHDVAFGGLVRILQ